MAIRSLDIPIVAPDPDDHQPPRDVLLSGFNFNGLILRMYTERAQESLHNLITLSPSLCSLSEPDGSLFFCHSCLATRPWEHSF